MSAEPEPVPEVIAEGPATDTVVSYRHDRDLVVPAKITAVHPDGRVDLEFVNGPLMIFGAGHGSTRLKVRPGYGSKEAGTWSELPPEAPVPTGEPPSQLIEVFDVNGRLVPATITRDKDGRIRIQASAISTESPGPTAESIMEQARKEAPDVS